MCARARARAYVRACVRARVCVLISTYEVVKTKAKPGAINSILKKLANTNWETDARTIYPDRDGTRQSPYAEIGIQRGWTDGVQMWG